MKYGSYELKEFERVYSHYIEMCKNAPEIQKIKCAIYAKDFSKYTYNDEDLIYKDGKLIQVVDWSDFNYIVENTIQSAPVWIPTFDQWIEIYRDNNPTVYESSAIAWFSDFVQDEMRKDNYFDTKYQSKEELIMLFVMLRIYHKYYEFERQTWKSE